MKTENDNEDMFNLSKGLDNFVQVQTSEETFLILGNLDFLQNSFISSTTGGNHLDFPIFHQRG